MSISIRCKQQLKLHVNDVTQWSSRFDFKTYQLVYCVILRPLNPLDLYPPGRLVSTADLGAIASEFPNKNEVLR